MYIIQKIRNYMVLGWPVFRTKGLPFRTKLLALPFRTKGLPFRTKVFFTVLPFRTKELPFRTKELPFRTKVNL